MNSPPPLRPIVRARKFATWRRRYGTILCGVSAFVLAFVLILGGLRLYKNAGAAATRSCISTVMRSEARSEDHAYDEWLGFKGPACYLRPDWSRLAEWLSLSIPPPASDVVCLLDVPMVPRVPPGPSDERRPFDAIRRAFWPFFLR